MIHTSKSLLLMHNRLRLNESRTVFEVAECSTYSAPPRQHAQKHLGDGHGKGASHAHMNRASDIEAKGLIRASLLQKTWSASSQSIQASELSDSCRIVPLLPGLKAQLIVLDSSTPFAEPSDKKSLPTWTTALSILLPQAQ